MAVYCLSPYEASLNIWRHVITRPCSVVRDLDKVLASQAVLQTCDTPLPANFCTCGRYMLFVDEPHKEPR